MNELDHIHLLERALGTLDYPLYVIDANDYTIKVANPAAYPYLEAFPCADCHELLHEQDQPCNGQARACRLNEIKRTKQPVVVEHEQDNGQGRRKVFEIHGYPVLDQQGNVAQIIEFVLDISKRRLGEEALAESWGRQEEPSALLSAIALLNSYTLESLQNSEARFRAVAQNASDAIITIDGHGTIIFWNEAAETILGYRSEEVLGRSVALIMPERFRAAHHASMQRFVSTEESRLLGQTREMVGLRKDGSEFPVELSLSTWKINGNRFFTGILRDVTARKAMEAALQRERDFTAAVLDTAGALVVVLDPYGRIVHFNHACEALTSYTFSEVEGKIFWDLFLAPEELEPVKAVFAQLQAGQFPNKHENHWIAKDGGRRLIAWSNTALLDAAGTVEYIIGTGIDVTEQRQAQDELKTAHDHLELRVEERTAELARANTFLQAEMVHHRQTAETLRESEERYRRLVELSFEAVIIHRGGKLVYINPAGAELLGAAHPEELRGKPLRDLIHPDYWDLVQARVQEVREEGKGTPLIEQKWLRLDGTSVDVEKASVPVVYGGAPAVQSVIRDISARKRAEEERERERTRIARDLHDSLGHSLGFLHLKLDQLAGSEAPTDSALLKGELAHMRDVANEAYELVRGMLAALLPSGSTDLATAMLMEARSIGERGGFEVEVSTDGQPRRLDPVVQQQILYLFQEALTNVERHACAQQAHVKLSWEQDHLTIALTDDGCGFDVGGNQPRGHYGLRIMRERAAGLNGQLTLASRPGAGSEVVLQVTLASNGRRPEEP